MTQKAMASFPFFQTIVLSEWNIEASITLLLATRVLHVLPRRAPLLSLKKYQNDNMCGYWLLPAGWF